MKGRIILKCIAIALIFAGSSAAAQGALQRGHNYKFTETTQAEYKDAAGEVHKFESKVESTTNIGGFNGTHSNYTTTTFRKPYASSYSLSNGVWTITRQE